MHMYLWRTLKAVGPLSIWCSTHNLKEEIIESPFSETLVLIGLRNFFLASAPAVVHKPILEPPLPSNSAYTY